MFTAKSPRLLSQTGYNAHKKRNLLTYFLQQVITCRLIGLLFSKSPDRVGDFQHELQYPELYPPDPESRITAPTSTLKEKGAPKRPFFICSGEKTR